jgi:hypothetical protein
MDTVVSVLLTNYSSVFTSIPHAALMFRVASKSICKSFDTHLPPSTWYLWVQHLIPKITGLPSDLKAEYYAVLLRNYFGPLPADFSRRRCFHMRKLGNIIHVNFWVDDRVYEAISYFRFLTSTAKGRAALLSMLQEWEDSFDDTERERCITVVRTIRAMMEGVFILSPGAAIEAGARTFYSVTQREKMQMEEELRNWKR